MQAQTHGRAATGAQQTREATGGAKGTAEEETKQKEKNKEAAETTRRDQKL